MLQDVSGQVLIDNFATPESGAGMVVLAGDAPGSFTQTGVTGAISGDRTLSGYFGFGLGSGSVSTTYDETGNRGIFSAQSPANTSVPYYSQIGWGLVSPLGTSDFFGSLGADFQFVLSVESFLASNSQVGAFQGSHEMSLTVASGSATQSVALALPDDASVSSIAWNSVAFHEVDFSNVSSITLELQGILLADDAVALSVTDFRATAVPEPGVYSTLGGGLLLGFTLLRRRLTRPQRGGYGVKHGHLTFLDAGGELIENRRRR